MAKNNSKKTTKPPKEKKSVKKTLKRKADPVENPKVQIAKSGEETTEPINNSMEDANKASDKTLAPANPVIPRYDAKTISLMNHSLFNEHQLTLTAPIGTGENSIVYGAMDESQPDLIAVKIIESDKDRDGLVRHQVNALTKAKHQNVVRLIKYVQVGDFHHFLVMERFGTDLRSTIASGKKFPEKMAKKIVLDIATALEYIHRLKMSHGHVIPANVLISKDTAKLASFRLANLNGTTPSDKFNEISPHYLPPEFISKSQHSPLKVDIWQLGCIAFELITGEPAFKLTNLEEMKQNILKRELNPIWQKPVPLGGSASGFILSLLELDSSKRIDAAKVLALPWLTEK